MSILICQTQQYYCMSHARSHDLLLGPCGLGFKAFLETKHNCEVEWGIGVYQCRGRGSKRGGSLGSVGAQCNCYNNVDVFQTFGEHASNRHPDEKGQIFQTTEVTE